MKKIISKESDYALRVLIKLQQTNNPINMSSLSKSLFIGKAMLIKIIQILKSKNLIFTKKGKNGGIIINKKFINTNIYEIFQRLDIKYDISSCHDFNGKCCDLKNICQAYKVFYECKSFIDKKLQKVKLKDLAFENIT
jgi:Rrf2 family nitric oxide-sensitive transcriptional repressor